MKAVSKLIILSVVAVMVTLLGLQLSAAPALAERRSIGGEPVFPGGPTYERTIQTFFETYVFPAELKYQGVGVERDNVIVEKVERDGNSFWFSVRARYSGNLFGVGVAERARVHYDNGHIRVDLGGLKGIVNTRSIADTLIPQLANGTGSGGGGRGHYFYFRNNCHKPVRLVLRYKQLSGQWITQGWYSFDGNEASYLNSEPGVKLRSNNSIFYYYAESTDGSGSVWSGDENREFGGQSLPMKKKEVSLDSDSDWNLGIRCSS
jgi:hypothetical protein